MTPDQLLESLLRLQHFETSPEEKGERTLEILTHIEAQDRTIDRLTADATKREHDVLSGLQRIEQLEKDNARVTQ